MTYTLDDVNALWDGRIEVKRWDTTVMEAFDRLQEDSATDARAPLLNLHPWLTGQAVTGSPILEWYATAAVSPAAASGPPVAEGSP
jgi:hypothetical protein